MVGRTREVVSSREISATLATAKRTATTTARSWRTASAETAASTAVEATAATTVEATTAATVEAATAATVPASAMLGESRTGNAHKRDRQKRREKKL
jgi:hypothetical protein